MVVDDFGYDWPAPALPRSVAAIREVGNRWGWVDTTPALERWRLLIGTPEARQAADTCEHGPRTERLGRAAALVAAVGYRQGLLSSLPPVERGRLARAAVLHAARACADALVYTPNDYSVGDVVDVMACALEWSAASGELLVPSVGQESLDDGEAAQFEYQKFEAARLVVDALQDLRDGVGLPVPLPTLAALLHATDELAASAMSKDAGILARLPPGAALALAQAAERHKRKGLGLVSPVGSVSFVPIL